ncbi:SWEET sugar transporter [Phytophthora cactorum]|nr:SWEET sugar transporter [Phytophthora cactorum]
MGFWVTLLNVSTGVADIFLRLSPVPDMYNVHRNKNIGEVAELPLITMVVNCHLCMFPLLGSQLFGEIVGILYNIVYYRWSPERSANDYVSSTRSPFRLVCGHTVRRARRLGVFGQTKSEVGTSLGYVGCAFSLSMFSSPLATLKHVVSTKSSASIPINMCTMILVSTALWTGSGIVDDDYFVAVINTVGVVLSCTQIAIYFMYRPGKNADVAMQLEAGKNASFIAMSPKTEPHSTVLVESPAYYKPMPSPLRYLTCHLSADIFHFAKRNHTMSNWFYAVLNVAAAIAQVILSLSPAPDIYNVHRRRDVGEMAALPLVAMAVNNHVATQAFSQFAAIIYSVIYSDGARSLSARSWSSYSPGLLRCTVRYPYTLCLALWGSQTKQIRRLHVVKTKNSTSIPINLSVMLLISTLLWLGTGILDSDLFIAGINSVGAALSLIQIVVYYHFRPTQHDELLLHQQDLATDMPVVIVTPKDDTSSTSLDTSTFKPMMSPRA